MHWHQIGCVFQLNHCMRKTLAAFFVLLPFQLKDAAVAGERAGEAQAVIESRVINKSQLLITITQKSAVAGLSPEMVTDGAASTSLRFQPFTPSTPPPVYTPHHSRSICQITAMQIW